ncbi:hypothetical protein X737_15235 [Mesorhizobium sp. L48C026A00]|nr:hypothetical protein X737_15235 [Mesorhizobium sp. L48C026A00]
MAGQKLLKGLGPALPGRRFLSQTIFKMNAPAVR